MIRACVGVLTEATVPTEAEIFTPGEIPNGVHLLERTYPMLLPKEAGEKAFELDEDLELPSSAPKIAKLLRFSLQPELIDQKVMSSKVVFRGVCLAGVFYTGEDGQLHSWSFEVPFSQYSELESDYEQDATAAVWMEVTALEMDMLPEGGLRLKAGLTGQYMISDREQIRVVEDAYSTAHKLSFEVQQLQLPAILDVQSQLIHAEGNGIDPQLHPVDIAFYPDQPYMSRTDDDVTGELSGYYQILGYDAEGKPAAAVSKWNGKITHSACESCSVTMHLQPSGAAQLLGAGNQPGADVLICAVTQGTDTIPMISALDLEERQPDPQRPSLILRRAGQESLWQLAKESGSTEQAIREANRIQQEPEPGQMLLIPVV